MRREEFCFSGGSGVIPSAVFCVAVIVQTPRIVAIRDGYRGKGRMDLIDHLGIGVADLNMSKQFYDAALAALSIVPIMEVTPAETGGYHGIGYGVAGKPSFWISNGASTGEGVHIAFSASSRADIDAFYGAALTAGGRDNGPPGIRSHYHPNYYAAFVLDPDGNNVEAVCHAPA